MAVKRYDIIIIGAGSGGLGVAIGMAKFGFDVLMIEKSKDNFGGECLNSGCVPSKALIHVCEILKNAKEAEHYGFKTEGKTDIKKVLEYVHSRQDIIREHESADYLQKEEGIAIEIGNATFISKNEIKVGEKTFTSKKILVATGSKPRMLKTDGLDKVKIFTNENLFHIDFLPENMLVIGGGPIGMEMGQCFARMGANVKVLEMKDRIMGNELPEVSELMKKRLEIDGMKFLLETELLRFEQDAVVVKTKNGEEKTIPCDAVLVGIGRVREFDELNLEKANIQTNDKGQPKVDDYLRAEGNKNVVFAGDAAMNLMFSHAAELHTSVLLTNFFVPWPFKKKLSFDHFSWCTFTDPQVCTFGFSEKEIKEKGISYDTINFDFELDDRAVVSDYRYGKLILFLKKNKLNPRNGKILGGTVVAPNAGEMAQELIMANEQGLGAGVIFNKIYPYPVQSRVHKIALVEEFSKDISPTIKKLMRFLY